jgi:hypothetical protein
MRPAQVAALPTLLFSIGCMVDISERSGYALDYHIDRPRVLAVAVDPPVLVHGRPSTVHTLALAPANVAPDAISVDVCGLQTDQLVSVFELDCFHQDELVTHLGDGADVTWEPPDLSEVACPDPDTAMEPDSGGGEDPPDPAPDPDTDVPPQFDYRCGSDVPLMVTASFGDELAFASLRTQVRLRKYEEGEYVPPGRYAAERTLTFTGEAVAGGEVELTFTLEAEANRFSWFVDAGELVGTGWTANMDPDYENSRALTRNTLRIPDDFHGPLRVVAVAVDDGFAWGVAGDSAWSVITLEVP